MGWWGSERSRIEKPKSLKKMSENCLEISFWEAKVFSKQAPPLPIQAPPLSKQALPIYKILGKSLEISTEIFKN